MMKEHSKDKNTLSVKLAVAVIIVISAMYLTVPREAFEDHLGVRYDIFCVAYQLLLTAATCVMFRWLSDQSIAESCEPGPAKVLCTAELILFLRIRAPPFLYEHIVA